MPVTRRQFFQAAALVGLTRKSGVRLTGAFVHDSHALGHRLRDRQLTELDGNRRRACRWSIVGGGIAGLSAAWRLTRRGFHDFVLLEMEPEAGGNARSGSNEVSAYPWAAHYVPVPGPNAPLVRELFERARRLQGRPLGRAASLSRATGAAVPARTLASRIRAAGRADRARPRPRRAFRGAGWRSLPRPAHSPCRWATRSPPRRLTGSRWRSGCPQEGLDSPWLRWLVDYGCRDDYGARAGDTSAWAGIHYFASRAPQETGPLTWPEGNGWITRRLLAMVGDRVKTGQIVTRVAREGRRWSVSTPEARWMADAVIFAAPSFLAARVIDDGPATPTSSTRPGSRPISRSIAGRRSAARPWRGTT